MILSSDAITVLTQYICYVQYSTLIMCSHYINTSVLLSNSKWDLKYHNSHTHVMHSAPLFCGPLVPAFLNHLLFFLRHNFLFHFPLHTRISPFSASETASAANSPLNGPSLPSYEIGALLWKIRFPFYDKSCEQQG